MQKLLFLVALCCVALSCKKEHSPKNSLSQIAPTKTLLEDAYVGDRVKALMVGLLDLSQNTNFVNLVNEEVSLQFDDDDNVLFRKLLTSCANHNINLVENMNNSVANHLSAMTAVGHPYDNYSILTGEEVILDIVNGFNWNDQHYYLQIYIPFVDQVNLSETPVICFGHQEV